jgi:hypothetical protein
MDGLRVRQHSERRAAGDLLNAAQAAGVLLGLDHEVLAGDDDVPAGSAKAFLDKYVAASSAARQFLRRHHAEFVPALLRRC